MDKRTYNDQRNAARRRLIERICPECRATHVTRAGREHDLCDRCQQERGYRLRQRERMSEQEASGILDAAVREETLMPWERRNFRSIWEKHQ